MKGSTIGESAQEIEKNNGLRNVISNSSRDDLSISSFENDSSGADSDSVGIGDNEDLWDSDEPVSDDSRKRRKRGRWNRHSTKGFKKSNAKKRIRS